MISCSIWPPPYNWERGIRLSGPRWFWEATYTSLGCVIPSHLPSDPKKLLLLGGTQNRTTPSNRSRLLGWAIWPSSSNGVWSQWNRDAVWSLWQASKDGSQQRLSGLEHSIAIFSFWEQLLALHGVLIETACLTMSPQLTMQAVLPNMNWALSDSTKL